MIDRTSHLRHVAQRGAFRTYLLWGHALTEADEHGAWEPDSKAALKRALATRDQGAASVAEVELALRQARSWGLIERASDWDRIVLTGQEMAE